MVYLVSGCAGFIGFNVTKKLLKKNDKVIGIDNLNNYYSVSLKKARLRILSKNKNFIFVKCDLLEMNKLAKIFRKYKFNSVVNLAAQAGVRYSLEKPGEYVKSNLVGFFNILELTRINKIKNFIYASSSSVYGEQGASKLSEIDTSTNNPEQFYAATKRSNEIIAKSYSNLYGIKTLGLRYFTVYGPYGRPDMSIFKFTKNILENKKIEVFNFGKHKRDFTYVEDAAELTVRLIKKINSGKKNFTEIFNISRGSSIPLMKIIKLLEKNLSIKAKIKYLPKQKGDVISTYGDNTKVKKYTNFTKFVKPEHGISKFVNWYLEYFTRQH